MSTSKKITSLVSILFTITPLLTYAATGKTLDDVITEIVGYFDVALAVLMGLAVIMFVWFVFRYFIATGEADRTKGAQYVGWSVLGFFVIFSMWGLVNILISTFDLGSNTPGSWTNLKDIFPK
jgi:hypothetical protein